MFHQNDASQNNFSSHTGTLTQPHRQRHLSTGNASQPMQGRIADIRMRQEPMNTTGGGVQIRANTMNLPQRNAGN
jgi:hypothetical protein